MRNLSFLVLILFIVLCLGLWRASRGPLFSEQSVKSGLVSSRQMADQVASEKSRYLTGVQQILGYWHQRVVLLKSYSPSDGAEKREQKELLAAAEEQLDRLDLALERLRFAAPDQWASMRARLDQQLSELRQTFLRLPAE
jgi:hypothetical protein